MAVMEIARLTCRSGRGDEFVEALKKGLSVQAEDPECLDIWFQRGVENPEEFLLHLIWTSIETHDAWRAAHRDRWRSHIVDLLEGLPQLLGHYQLAAVVKGEIGAPAATP
jgi:heme-degrading monooxygenase HmoA